MERLQTPPIVISDFVYLRLSGDGRLAESQFGKIQIDRSEEIINWGNPFLQIFYSNIDFEDRTNF
jgi:hypothetical protein